MSAWATPYIGRTDLHCWGLVRCIYAEHLRVALPSYAEVDYKELVAVANAVAAGTSYDGTWRQISPFPGAERAFDVVVMRGWLPCSDGVKRRGVVHTGVVSRPGHVLHTDMGYAVVEVGLGHMSVKRRLVACYRYARNGA